MAAPHAPHGSAAAHGIKAARAHGSTPAHGGRAKEERKTKMLTRYWNRRKEEGRRIHYHDDMCLAVKRRNIILW